MFGFTLSLANNLKTLPSLSLNVMLPFVVALKRIVHSLGPEANATGSSSPN